MRTGSLAVRVESPHGEFTLGEAGEAAWETGPERVAVRVLAGEMTLTDADPGAVVFRGEPEGAFRSYRAGFIDSAGLRALADGMASNSYGGYLRELLDTKGV